MKLNFFFPFTFTEGVYYYTCIYIQVQQVQYTVAHVKETICRCSNSVLKIYLFIFIIYLCGYVCCFHFPHSTFLIRTTAYTSGYTQRTQYLSTSTSMMYDCDSCSLQCNFTILLHVLVTYYNFKVSRMTAGPPPWLT